MFSKADPAHKNQLDQPAAQPKKTRLRKEAGGTANAGRKDSPQVSCQSQWLVIDDFWSWKESVDPKVRETKAACPNLKLPRRVRDSQDPSSSARKEAALLADSGRAPD